MISAVLIVPAFLHAQAEALSLAMGWGSPAYTVPLSADGSEPATHFGLHTWAEPSFPAMLSGPMPPQLGETGYPQEAFDAVIAGLISSCRDSMEGHFAEVITARGLMLVQPENPNQEAY